MLQVNTNRSQHPVAGKRMMTEGNQELELGRAQRSESPSVISEAIAEKSVAGSGLRRSLLIQRFEGSRSRVRRTRGAMGIESILISRPLLDGDFGQKPVIDTHRYMSGNHLRHLTSGLIRSSRGKVGRLCLYTRKCLPRKWLRSSRLRGKVLLPIANVLLRTAS